MIVLGEDVAEGGPYLATAGLADEFGRERVRNTPISEGTVCGVAIGAAQSGLQAGRRDHVHRLHHARARPARQSGGQGALHVRRPAVGAARAPHPGRGRPAQRRPALAEPRGVAHARARSEGRDAEQRRRRRRSPADRDRRPQPGCVRREQVAVLPARDGSRSSGTGPDRPGANASHRQGRHDHRAIADGRRRDAKPPTGSHATTGSRPR